MAERNTVVLEIEENKAVKSDMNAEWIKEHKAKFGVEPNFLMENKSPMKIDDMNNPFEGKRVVFVSDDNDNENADGERGHLTSVGISNSKRSVYDKVIKRLLDIILSFLGIIILSPFLLIVSLAILIDDPGPIIFTQKRIGINKKYFKLHKLRTMKMSTPHDIPTHMLNNPEQYITRIGRFIRKYSIDEIVQTFDIFAGHMSIIGPRPALWNQDVLIAERDKYGANDIKPGLTGWAQINGRDELDILIKAKLDGIYAEKLRNGGFTAFLFDCRCFFGTLFSVLRGDGVVEGGIGAMYANPIQPKGGETIHIENDYQMGDKN